MSNREEKEVRETQKQGALLIIGLLLATFAGVAVNAFYDVLIQWGMSSLSILLLFGGMTIFLIDLFTFSFENIKELRKRSGQSVWEDLRQYRKHRFKI